MSNARKLQTEIDRVMKKVDEGAELFDEIWLKVKSADSQNLKEKHEVDLKKEIKKLQRLRDQIKTWVGSSDVKDKDSLIDARKLIETKMETFKICEKETKTKTYSKEGLAREDKLDPAEEAKNETTAWLQEYLDKLQGQVEEKDFEIEKLSSGKGKKTNKHQIEDKQEHIINHRFHINKLEAIIRLVNNDAVEVDTVDAIKEDLDYYLDSHEEEDYRAGYDEEFFYETLGLEDILDVAVMGSTTGSSKKTEDSVSVTSSKGSSNVKSGKKSASVIPMTIGRARSSTAKKDQLGFGEEKEIASTTPKKATPPSHPKPAPGSAPRASTVAAPGASMASILSRQTELQEKERQKEQLRQEQLRQEQLRQQQQLKQQQEQLRQQEARRVAEEEAAAREREVKETQQRAAAALLAAEQQKNAVLQAQQQQAAAQQQQQQQPTAATMTSTAAATVAPTGAKNALDILSSGLSGLTGLGGVATSTAPPESRNTATDSASVLGSLTQSSTSTLKTATSGSDTSAASYLTALNESYVSAPGSGDAERSRPYTPQNPYPTLASYPTHPSPIFDSPVVFEKLGTDCLFFIFYYAQGTYQQYLAARELKKQSWRFHKKYQAWFQRHEEPKITTDDYEQGTYVYFDYETGWCTRIKQDFRFEYSYLEDSLQ